MSENFPQAYTVCGEEYLLIQEKVDALRHQGTESGYRDREIFYIDARFDWRLLEQAIQMRSLFSTQRLLELRIKTLALAKPIQKLKSCLAALPSDVMLILVLLPPIDWQDRKKSWFKILQKQTKLFDFKALSLEQMPAWIATRLEQQQQSADPETLNFLAHCFESNLLAAHQEIQKFALLLPPGKLDGQQVRDLCMHLARYQSAVVTQSLLEGQVSRFLNALEGLQQQGDSSALVIWHLSRDLRKLLQLKRTSHAGAEDYRALGLFGEQQRRFKRASRRYDRNTLQAGLACCQNADALLKGILPPNSIYDNSWHALQSLALLFKA